MNLNLPNNYVSCIGLSGLDSHIPVQSQGTMNIGMGTISALPTMAIIYIDITDPTRLRSIITIGYAFFHEDFITQGLVLIHNFIRFPMATPCNSIGTTFLACPPLT